LEIDALTVLFGTEHKQIVLAEMPEHIDFLWKIAED